jgi:hypothetical protein
MMLQSSRGRFLKRNSAPELEKLARLRKKYKNVSIIERPSLARTLSYAKTQFQKNRAQRPVLKKWV